MCELCDGKLESSIDLQTHIKTIHSTDSWFQCITCKYGTPLIWNFREHLAVHRAAVQITSKMQPSNMVNTDALLYQCTYCSEICQSLEEAWTHHKEHAVSISKNNNCNPCQ